MLSIGDFSKLAQVSIRTLRLYDALDLLKPVSVDRSTGYRYYSVDQLPRINRILMLKELGLSLEQIAKLLAQDLPADQLRGMLTIKKAELQQELTESKLRLERVEMRLQQIEQEGKLTNYDVVLKAVEPITICSIRQIVPTMADMPPVRAMMFSALENWVVQQRIKRQGAELAIYHNAEYTEQNIDMEAAIRIDKTYSVPNGPQPQSADNIVVRELPGTATMASVIHHGQPKQVGQAIIALYTWIGQHQYTTDGPYREIHLFGNELELKTRGPVTMELQIPIVINKV